MKPSAEWPSWENLFLARELTVGPVYAAIRATGAMANVGISDFMAQCSRTRPALPSPLVRYDHPGQPMRTIDDLTVVSHVLVANGTPVTTYARIIEPFFRDDAVALIQELYFESCAYVRVLCRSRYVGGENGSPGPITVPLAD